MAKGFYGGIGSWENPGIRFKQFGNWEEAIRVIQKLKPSIKNASIAAQISVCNDICKRVKNHILKQDLGWVPLQPGYAVLKESVGGYTQTMMLWGDYYDAIKVWRTGNQHMVFVGVKKGIYSRDINGKRNRLEIAQIAAIHEFSASLTRRRPLWNPTIQEIGGVKGLKTSYLFHLFKQLRIRQVPVSYKAGSLTITIDNNKFKL